MTNPIESDPCHKPKSARVRQILSGAELLAKAREHLKREDDEAARYCYESAISRGIERTPELDLEFARTNGEVALDPKIAALLGIIAPEQTPNKAR